MARWTFRHLPLFELGSILLGLAAAEGSRGGADGGHHDDRHVIVATGTSWVSPLAVSAMMMAATRLTAP